MGDTDLVVDLPVLLEVDGVLVQLAAIDTADAVDDQMIVQMVGVNFFAAVKVAITSPPC
jgi:hypothetical protein